LEGSPDNFAETDKWETIFEMKNQKCIQRGMNTFTYHSQSSNHFSTIRFIMIGKNSVNSSDLRLEGFEIFGALMDLYHNISLLKKMVTRTKVSIHQSTSYSFLFFKTSSFGLFNKLSSFPSKIALKSFSLIRSSTLEGSSIFNLLTWDNLSWTSENSLNLFGFAFNLRGDKILSAENYFPVSWKIEGITAKRCFILIHEQNKNSSLCSPFKESMFRITCNQYFRGFRVTQIGKNAQGTQHFSLSAIEWFGDLQTFTKEDQFYVPD
jgi:hypothetical protein